MGRLLPTGTGAPGHRHRGRGDRAPGTGRFPGASPPRPPRVAPQSHAPPQRHPPSAIAPFRHRIVYPPANARGSGFTHPRTRTDCLVGLQQTYDWNPKFVSSQGQYTDLDKGQAEFTMGFSTDGPLSLDKYVTYEDDKMLFPPYYVTLLTRTEAAAYLGVTPGTLAIDVSDERQYLYVHCRYAKEAQGAVTGLDELRERC